MAAITDTVIAINENQFVFRGKVRFKHTGFHSDGYVIEIVSYVKTKIWNIISAEYKE